VRERDQLLLLTQQRLRELELRQAVAPSSVYQPLAPELGVSAGMTTAIGNSIPAHAAGVANTGTIGVARMIVEAEVDPTTGTTSIGAAAAAAATTAPPAVGTGAIPDPRTTRDAELRRQMDELVARAWESVFFRMLAPRNAVMNTGGSATRQVSARTATMARILTATPLDNRERGVAPLNDDHSTVLPEGRVHGRGFDMEIFTPSELPRIGDEAHVARLLVSSSGTGYDPDRFQLDSSNSPERARVCPW
jgi:hypothetical protein